MDYGWPSGRIFRRFCIIGAANGDLTRYLSYHTADYSETDPQGRHTQIHGREQDRKQAKGDIQWIKHWNATNRVTFHYRDTVKSLGPAGKDIRVTAEECSSIQPPLVEREQDTWEDHDGRWLLAQRRHGTMHGAEAPTEDTNSTTQYH